LSCRILLNVYIFSNKVNNFSGLARLKTSISEQISKSEFGPLSHWITVAISQRIMLTETETDKIVNDLEIESFFLPYIERILQIFYQNSESFESELKKAIISLVGHFNIELTRCYSTGSQGAIKSIYANGESLLEHLLGYDCVKFMKTHSEACIEKSVDYILEFFKYMKSKENTNLNIVRLFNIEHH
jgi:hypothetical protein